MRQIILSFIMFILLVAGSAFAQVPEIARLKPWSEIPPAVFEKYSANEIAKAIVDRLRDLTLDPNGDEAFYLPNVLLEKIKFDPELDTEIQLYFPIDRVQSVVSARQFLNIHQAPNIQYQESRSEYRHGVENAAARLQFPKNLKIKPLVNLVQPKSATLEFKLPIDQRPYTAGAIRYGELVAVLKDRVKERVTYTPYDSSALMASSYSTEDRYRKEVRPLLGTDYFFKNTWDSNFINDPYTTEYYEAMVWGTIELQDIKEFLVPHDVDKVTFMTLKSTGIPIYEYIEETEGKLKNQYYSRYRRVRGKRLYRGSMAVCRSLLSEEQIQ